MLPASGNRLFWATALLGAVADRIAKYWVTRHFEVLGQTVPLWPGVFHFTYAVNPGAAFSLFDETGGWLRWLSLAVSLGLAGWAWLGPRFKRLEQLGYGAILAGAIGNGIDRFAFGYVIDFLDVRLIGFPIFNLADVGINLGIVSLLASALWERSPRHR